MSYFAVTIERIKSSVPHSNADRLDVSMLEGMNYQFVTGRGEFAPGDAVLYFPLDSVLPAAIIEKLGLVGLLAGAQKNRVKTVTLRGEISQGLVSRPSKFLTEEQMQLSPEQITELLGVTKYEPEPIIVQCGTLMPLPVGTSVYDIEGADRFTEVVDTLADQPVSISEKMEGTNFSVTLDTEDRFFVNQREHTIIPDPDKEHFFWAAARDGAFFDKLRLIRERILSKPELAAFRNQSVSIYGELCGPKIQDNIYQLKKAQVFAFDIRTEKGFLNADEFYSICNDMEIVTTPVLSHGVTLREWLCGLSVAVAAGGPSVLNPNQKREGVVIKPLVEGRWSRGRLIIKQRCPIYLAKSKLA